jgi:hypothetical protein
MPKTIFEEREKLRRCSPLLITTTFPEEWQMNKIEFTRPDGTIGKQSLPTTQMESTEHILYCLTEFNEAALEYSWQGQARFVKYRQTPRGTARTTWDQVLQLGQQNFQVATFNNAIRRMIGQMTGNLGFANFMQYVEHVKKPLKMTPAILVNRLVTLFSYSQYLTMEDGTAPQPIPDVRQREIIVNAFPDAWVDKFRDANMIPATTPIGTILQYMNIQQSHEPTNDCKGSSTQDNNRDISRSRSSYAGRGHGRSNDGCRGDRNGGRGRDERGHGRGENLPRIQPDDICRLHGGHKWRKCFYNPHRDDDGNQGRGGRGNGRGRDRDTNYSSGRGRASSGGNYYNNDGNNYYSGNGGNQNDGNQHYEMHFEQSRNDCGDVRGRTHQHYNMHFNNGQSRNDYGDMRGRNQPFNRSYPQW